MIAAYTDLCRAVASCGLPFARVCWDKDDPDAPPPLPYALLVPGATRDVMAGSRRAAEVTPYTVELYERGSSLDLEARLEAALDAAGLPFERRCVPLDGGVVEMAYEVTVLGR